MSSGFESWRQRHMWVEFVVGSLPCSERFFSGYSGFPLSLKTNTFKFQFDTDTFERVLMKSSDPWVNKLQFTTLSDISKENMRVVERGTFSVVYGSPEAWLKIDRWRKC